MDNKTIDILNKEYFPLFKVVFEDGFRFREVDSEVWLDSDEDELLRSSKTTMLYIKKQYGDEWEVLYDGLSNDLIEASIDICKIKELYKQWIWMYVDEPPVMFIYQNQVFKNPYVMFDQLCISGYPIEPNKYYTNGESVKVNFFKSYVKPIPKDTLLCHADQFYLNGNLIYTKEQLNELNIKTYGYYGETKEFIKKNIPSAKRYEWLMDSGLINHE